MAENFLSIQNKVITRLMDAQANVTGEVPAMINFAIRDLEDEMNFGCMKGETSFTTLQNTRLIGRMPDDYKEKRSDAYWLDQVGAPKFLTWQPTSEMSLRRYSRQESKVPAIAFTDVGQPQWLAPVFDEGAGVAGEFTSGPFDVNVFPLPDANGFDFLGDGITKTYRIYAPYWRYIPDLAGDGDQNWFTFNAPQYLIAQATGHCLMIDRDEQRATGWYGIASSWKQKVKVKAANETRSPGKSMAARSDVDAERDQYRRS